MVNNETLERRLKETEDRLDNLVKNFNAMVRYIQGSVKPVIDIETQKLAHQKVENDVKNTLSDILRIFHAHSGKPNLSDFSEEQIKIMNETLETVKKTHPTHIKENDTLMEQYLSACSFSAVCVGVDLAKLILGK